MMLRGSSRRNAQRKQDYLKVMWKLDGAEDLRSNWNLKKSVEIYFKNYKIQLSKHNNREIFCF